MTSGSGICDSVRFLLHDGDRQSDTGSHFYSDASIERALTEALAVLMRDLILPQDPHSGARVPRQANISVAALAALYTPTWATTPQNERRARLPDDFYILECGLLAGAYVPAIPAPLGETIAGTGIAKLYAFAGNLYGPEATAVYYFRRSPSIKASSQSRIPYLSDAVLNCAKYAACRDLVVQHAKSAWHRWGFFENEYQTQKASLQ